MQFRPLFQSLLSKRFPAAILEAVLQAGHGLQWDFTHLMAMFMQTAGTAGVLLHFTRITITIPRKKLRFLKQRLKVILTHIKNDHKAFTSFLSKKVASQWNNPEFQCFWITNVRSSDIEKSPVISDILSLKGSSTFIAFLNIMQSIILFGSMLYAVNTLIEGTFAGAAVLPLTFIGGFIFHLFWEGKCQYTLPYFMLLLPLSIIGFLQHGKETVLSHKEAFIQMWCIRCNSFIHSNYIQPFYYS